MQAEADMLHEEADHTPSVVPGCIDIQVGIWICDFCSHKEGSSL